MADIFPKVDDVIQKPDAGMYASKLKRTKPDSTGIVNYGLSRLVDMEEQLDEQALLDQYQGDLASTNQQRTGLAEIAARANAEMEARQQNLNFGAATKDRIALEPLMQAAGVPMDPSGQQEMDAINKQGLLAKIAKDSADAAKSRSEGGQKKEIERTNDSLSGKNAVKLKGPWTVNDLPTLINEHGLDPTEARALLSGKSNYSLLGDQTSSMGGQSSFHSQAATAAAPPTSIKVGGQSIPLQGARPSGDGNFEVEVFDGKRQANRTVIVDGEGRVIGAKN